MGMQRLCHVEEFSLQKMKEPMSRDLVQARSMFIPASPAREQRADDRARQLRLSSAISEKSLDPILVPDAIARSGGTGPGAPCASLRVGLFRASGVLSIVRQEEG